MSDTLNLTEEIKNLFVPNKLVLSKLQSEEIIIKTYNPHLLLEPGWYSFDQNWNPVRIGPLAAHPRGV